MTQNLGVVIGIRALGGEGPEGGFLIWGNDPGWDLPREYISRLLLLVGETKYQSRQVETTKL